MTKLSKERFQKLAGITTKEDDTDAEVITEGMKIFGMASPGVLGNPFEKRDADINEQSVDDSPASRLPSREDEEEGRLDLGDLSDYGSQEDIRDRRSAEKQLITQMKSIIGTLTGLGDYPHLDKAVELLNSMIRVYNG